MIVRGSIPLLWTQLPNLKYKPTTVIAPPDMNGPVSLFRFDEFELMNADRRAMLLIQGIAVCF